MLKNLVVTAMSMWGAAMAARAEEPTLILNFDINGTILAKDDAGGKTQLGLLSSILAKKTSGLWSPEQTAEMPYATFLKTQEPQGVIGEARKEAKRLRNLKLTQFVDQFATDPRFGPALKARQLKLDGLLAGMKTGIFDSFFALLAHLETNQVRYHLVLRTFGSELDEVATIIEGQLGRRFTKGYFKDGVLHIAREQGEELVSDPRAIHHIMVHTPMLAVRDEFDPWAHHGESWRHGKKFFYQMLDRKILPLFFDDNIEAVPDKSNNIVQPVYVSADNKLERIYPGLFYASQLIRVDTEQAIERPDYFIEKVNEALAAFKAKGIDPEQHAVVLPAAPGQRPSYEAVSTAIAQLTASSSQKNYVVIADNMGAYHLLRRSDNVTRDTAWQDKVDVWQNTLRGYYDRISQDYGSPVLPSVTNIQHQEPAPAPVTEGGAECLFCNKLELHWPESRFQYFVVAVNTQPSLIGHLLVIPKRHLAKFADLSPDEYYELQSIEAELRRDFLEQHQASRALFIAQNGRSAGQTIAHFHLHAAPILDKGHSLAHIGETILLRKGDR